MILQGLNSIGDDSYFIRLTNKKEFFIHLEREDDKECVYIIREGVAGACIWSKKDGEGFINKCNGSNLELVKVTKILENDGSLN